MIPSLPSYRGLLPPHRGLSGGARLGRRGRRSASQRAPPRLAIVELHALRRARRVAGHELEAARTLVVAVSPLAAGTSPRRSGADAFLQKPIDPVVLLSTVRDLLGTSALTADAGAVRLVIARLPSGIARLDQILAGGLAENSINLIIGVPG